MHSPSSSRTTPPSTLALVLAFGTIYLAWGSTYLSMKVAVATMPPYAMAGARFLLGGLILYAINSARGILPPTPRQWGEQAFFGVLLLLGGNGLVAWAGQFMPSGVTALLLGMSPLFMVLVEWAWPGGQRPTLMMLAGLGLGLAGAAWLAAPWEHTAAGGLPVHGLLGLLVACVSWAVGSIASRRNARPPHLLVAASVQMIGGGVALLGVSLVSGDAFRVDIAAISRESWLAWLYLVVISLIAFPTYAWLIKNSTPARVSTYAYVNPVVALVLGWWLLDEPMHARTLTAAIVIIASVVLIKLPHAERRAAPAAADAARPSGPVRAGSGEPALVPAHMGTLLRAGGPLEAERAERRAA